MLVLENGHQFLTLKVIRLTGRRAPAGYMPANGTLFVNTPATCPGYAIPGFFQSKSIETSSIVMVTSRLPEENLFLELSNDDQKLREAGIQTLRQIGDCHGPATIAAAVYEGHRFAREHGETDSEIPFAREITELSSDFELP
jgi:dimethylamine/trimethylamine dehydrogenase